jgi:redox-sensitive bicupin YhaK (pirin superfamily)
VAPTLLDVTVPEKGRLRLDGLPPTHTVIAYVTEGAARFGDEINATEAGNLAILGPGDTITAEGATCKCMDSTGDDSVGELKKWTANYTSDYAA